MQLFQAQDLNSYPTKQGQHDKVMQTHTRTHFDCQCRQRNL